MQQKIKALFLDTNYKIIVALRIFEIPIFKKKSHFLAISYSSFYILNFMFYLYSIKRKKNTEVPLHRGSIKPK